MMDVRKRILLFVTALCLTALLVLLLERRTHSETEFSPAIHVPYEVALDSGNPNSVAGESDPVSGTSSLSPSTQEDTVEETISTLPGFESSLPENPLSSTSEGKTESLPVFQPLRVPDLSDDNLPEELFLPVSGKGSVEIVEYTTHDLVSGGEYPILKHMAVYLPYGYTADEQYDVLLLLHPAWADHRFWLAEPRDYAFPDGSRQILVPDLLDAMIENAYCNPLIVVSPCIYLYDGQPSNAGNEYDYLQFEREIGTDLLPYIAEHYSTWAVDGTRDSLRQAREHFGVLGASFGAYTIYISLLSDNYDLFAWYCLCGGGALDPSHLEERWLADGTQDLPLGMLYIAEGEFDDRAGPEGSYHSLLTYGGTFTEDNVRFTLIRGYGHEDHSYLVGLYNALQMFFR